MAKLRVLACPGCGASLSVDDDPTITCQFCQNTIFVPEEFRPKDSASTGPAPSQGVPTSLFGSPAQLKQLGDLVRSGNKVEAIRLYRTIFHSSLAEASDAVERLSRGEPVQVTHVQAAGGPASVRVAGVSSGAPPAGGFQVGGVPVGQAPVTRRTSGSGSRGCVVGVVVILALGAVLAGLAASALPALMALPFLGNIVGQVTNVYASLELSFGGEGTGPGLFTDLRNVAVGPDGRIYAADFENPRVQIFDTDGTYLEQWKLGDKNTYLTAMVVDRQGRVFAVYGSEIHIHDADTGEALGVVEYEEGWGFESLSLTAEGGLVAGWYKSHDDIIVFSPDLEPTLVIPSAISTAAEDTELSTRVAVDGLGNIFAVGSFTEGIFRFSPTGRFQNRFSGDGDGPGLFTSAGAIAVDGQSRVYVADFDGIEVFRDNGQHVANIHLPDMDPYVYGMTFDDAGFLYAAAGNKIYKFRVNGE